jgi:Ion channel
VRASYCAGGMPVPRRLVERYGAHSFGVPLVLVICTIVFTIAAPSAEWTRVVWTLLASATLLSAVWASGAPRRSFLIASIAAGVAVIAALVSLASSRDTSTAITAFVAGSLVAVAPLAIVRSIFYSTEVTVRTVLGAVTTYLLIGLTFGFVYSLVAAVDSDPFFVGTASERGGDFVYFSFVTMSTVGYGDLVAAEDLGRSLAVLEAVMGQLYLVTVVAVVVSNLGRGRLPRTERLHE